MVHVIEYVQFFLPKLQTSKHVTNCIVNIAYVTFPDIIVLSEKNVVCVVQLKVNTICPKQEDY